MKMLIRWFKEYFHGEEGQTLVEFILILVLIAVVVILMLKTLGGNVNNTYSVINSAIPHT